MDQQIFCSGSGHLWFNWKHLFSVYKVMRVEAQQLIMSSVIRLFMTINFSSLYLYGAVATFVASPQPIL